MTFCISFLREDSNPLRHNYWHWCSEPLVPFYVFLFQKSETHLVEISPFLNQVSRQASQNYKEIVINCNER